MIALTRHHRLGQGGGGSPFLRKRQRNARYGLIGVRSACEPPPPTHDSTGVGSGAAADRCRNESPHRAAQGSPSVLPREPTVPLGEHPVPLGEALVPPGALVFPAGEHVIPPGEAIIPFGYHHIPLRERQVPTAATLARAKISFFGRHNVNDRDTAKIHLSIRHGLARIAGWARKRAVPAADRRFTGKSRNGARGNLSAS